MRIACTESIKSESVFSACSFCNEELSRLLIVFTTLSTEAPVTLYFSIKPRIFSFISCGRLSGLSLVCAIDFSCSRLMASNLYEKLKRRKVDSSICPVKFTIQMILFLFASSILLMVPFVFDGELMPKKDESRVFKSVSASSIIRTVSGRLIERKRFSLLKTQFSPVFCETFNSASFLKISGFKPEAFASDFANSVFPLPGLPYNRREMFSSPHNILVIMCVTFLFTLNESSLYESLQSVSFTRSVKKTSKFSFVMQSIVSSWGSPSSSMNP